MNGDTMTDIRERRVVHCPDLQASDYLAAFVADHQRSDGRVRMALSECSAVATLGPLKSTGKLHPKYSVTWSPKGGGPSAEFAGALAVVKSSGEDCFGLILSGQCKLRDAVGAMCNATHGRRIARLSARNVLRVITNYIENARAHNEAALAGHKRLTYLSVTKSQRRVDAVSNLQRASDVVPDEVGRRHLAAPSAGCTPSSSIERFRARKKDLRETAYCEASLQTLEPGIAYGRRHVLSPA